MWSNEKSWGPPTRYLKYADDAKIPFKLHDENGDFYTPENLPDFTIMFFIEFREKQDGYVISKAGTLLEHCETQKDVDGSVIIFANIPGGTFKGNPVGSRLFYKVLPKFVDENFPDGFYNPSSGGFSGMMYII